MPGRSERQDQSSNDSKKKAVSRSENRARLMIAFLWTLLFVIEAILFGIAIASWQKGSVWSGLWWGIGGYVVLGIGAVFAYYFYVIEPAKTANPSPDIPPDRPWMELEVSAYGDISFDQNGNATFPIKFIANNSGRMPANKVGLDAKVIVPPFGKNHFTAPIKQRDAICGPALTTFGPFGFGTVFAGKNSELEIAFLVDARTMNP